ncbi:MAG: DNA polymerase III subunit gamma/tau [Candidatus Pelagadaptatus aseana]|uniref:DNA polymerase III subunit gamma/tau n=1 Tax=Candidatus Pelagadaptatus aseana TaxID=3120508 RepID=UPI0039B310A5
MSYQVLARKWRPRSFRELVGQQHVLQALVNALDHNRLHHAYLFTGTRGVGKTTIARILARCLNCETGVSSEPCGQCSACVEINEGRFVDLIEVDAASRTKVEDTRELLENVQYAPTRGRYKVYLIDEVHMLSAHSFNALLKTLEEPPPHVKFLLATTDPQKLPVTILSRCLQFHLKNMEPERIVGHLKYVLEQEMVPFEESALWQLGRAADGSMRDAMSLTDQAIAFGGGKVAESEVVAMLGTIDQNLVFEVLNALAAHDGKKVLDAVAHLSEHAPDYSAALADLLSVLHRIAIAQTLPEAIDNHRGDQQQILSLAQTLAPEDVQLFYQTGLLGRRDLPLSPDGRTGFEMVLLRMLAFRPQGVHSVPTEPLAASTPVPPVQTGGGYAEQEEPAPVKKPEAAVGAAPAATRSSASAQPAPITAEPATGVEASVAEPVMALDELKASLGLQPARDIKPAVREEEVAPKVEAASEQPVAVSPEVTPADVSLESKNSPSADKPEPPVAHHSAAVSVAKIDLAELNPENWIQVYAGLGVGGLLQSTASNCQLVGCQEGELHFLLDEGSSTLYDESHQQRLSDMLSDYFQQPVRVVIQLGQVQGETPASYAIRLKQQRHADALASLENDPVVQQLLSEFDGQLDTDSVEPL